jgi:hypothetical protein
MSLIVRTKRQTLMDCCPLEGDDDGAKEGNNLESRNGESRFGMCVYSTTVVE